MDECAICYEKKELFITECKHSFCINCISKLQICAICRNPLQRAKLCSEIKLTNFRLQLYNRTDICIEGPYISTILPIIDMMNANGDRDFQLPLRIDMTINEDILQQRVNGLSPIIREEIIRLITLYQLTNEFIPCDEDTREPTGHCLIWITWIYRWFSCC